MLVGRGVFVGGGVGVFVPSGTSRVAVGRGVQVARTDWPISTSAAVLTFRVSGVTGVNHSASEPSTVTASTGQFCTGQSGTGVAVGVRVAVRVGSGVFVGRGVRVTVAVAVAGSVPVGVGVRVRVGVGVRVLVVVGPDV